MVEFCGLQWGFTRWKSLARFAASLRFVRALPQRRCGAAAWLEDLPRPLLIRGTPLGRRCEPQ